MKTEMYLDSDSFESIMMGRKLIAFHSSDLQQRDLSVYDRIRFLSCEFPKDYAIVEIKKFYYFQSPKELYSELHLSELGYDESFINVSTLMNVPQKHSAEQGKSENLTAFLFDNIQKFRIDDNGRPFGSCAACKKLHPIEELHWEQSCGPISYPYCRSCLENRFLPYDNMVWYVSSQRKTDENFADFVPDYYWKEIRRLLPFWGKTEQEFIDECNYKVKHQIIER